MCNGQDLVSLNGAPEPFGEGDLAVHQAAPGVVFPAQVGGVDEAEDIGVDNVAGTDIGADGAAPEAEDGFLEGCVVLAAEGSVGKAQQVGRVDNDAAGGWFTAVAAVHDVADRVDEGVLS